MELLEMVHTLLGEDVAVPDNLLNLYIDIVKQRILNYCNLYELPFELRFTTAQMVVDLLNEAHRSSENAEISSMSEGGSSITFKAFKIAADEKISKMQELNKFKELYKYGKPEDYSASD